MLLAHDLVGPEAGPLVVLLHGLSGNRRTWDAIATELVGDGFRVAQLDLRGHGESGHGGTYNGAYNIVDDYATDVAETIRSLTDEPVILAGHSLGGVTTLAVGQTHPELVRALYCEDPPAFEGSAARRAESPAAGYFGAFVAKIREWQAEGASVAEVADVVGAQPDLSGLARQDRIGREAIEDIARGLLRFDPGAMEAAIVDDMWAGFDPLAPVSAPLFVLRADPAAGAVFIEDDVAPFLAAHPDAGVEMAAGEGHSIHESPEGRARFLETFRTFVAGLA